MPALSWGMRLGLWLSAMAAWGQTYEVTPDTARQGDTLRVHAAGPASAARMNGRTIRLFPQTGGGSLGLMPVAVDTAPGKYPVEFLDAASQPLHSVPVAVRDARFPVQNVTLGKATAELQPAPGEMEAVAAFRQTVTDTRYWADPLRAPVAGCMVSRFGVRRLINGKPTGNFHGGIDQRAAAGRGVAAVAPGVVRIVRMFNLNGGTVGVDHGQGLLSIYLHLSGFAVKEGATVKQGEIIGLAGSTGRSSAPHLHWSLYANGVPVNPLQWVPLKPCAAR